MTTFPIATIAMLWYSYWVSLHRNTFTAVLERNTDVHNSTSARAQTEPSPRRAGQ